MKKMHVLKFIIYIYLLIIMIDIIQPINATSRLSINYEFEETSNSIEYFDVSDNRICVTYENGIIYELTFSGEFIRMIEYKTRGLLYSFYNDDNNLIVYPVREKKCYIIDVDGIVVDEYKEKNVFNGYPVYADITDDIVVNKNEYSIVYKNANWFERTFQNKKSSITIFENNVQCFKILEGRKVLNDLFPIGFLIIFIIISIYLLKFKKVNIFKKYK